MNCERITLSESRWKLPFTVNTQQFNMSGLMWRLKDKNPSDSKIDKMA